ncbi:MAG: tRNA (adenine(22)-N(1))-methyltransferase TrmK [Dehalococcoidales bacterium]|nr:MAG: tRNA (adenine(22)-N(1))-methyltransferase TrmK [Dehalococcoidales bacterium]
MDILFLPITRFKTVKSLEQKFSALLRSLIEDIAVSLETYDIPTDEPWLVEQEPASLVQWVPTPFEVARKMLELAQVSSKDRIYDLGSGDSRILIMAVEEFGVQKAVGYEIRKGLYQISKQKVQYQNLQDRITLIKGNLLNADISGASVITVYLSPKANKRLRPKLEKESRPGTRVVSYDFPIGNWKADKKVRLGKYPGSERSHTKTIYMYVLPQAFAGSTHPSAENKRELTKTAA